MTPRIFCLVAAFSLALFANALAFRAKGKPDCDALHVAKKQPDQPPSLLSEIHLWGTHKSLTFESVSHNGMGVYGLEFGPGYVDLDLASLGPDGKAQFHSFHMHY